MRIFLNRYTIFPNAKINLGLNVYKKDESGYHELDTIMLPIDLKDELDILIFERIGNLKIVCSDENIPIDEKNILYKTYKLFFKKIKKENLEINVNLKKNIPSEAGLGGGSSDAAFFLKVLNEYYDDYFNIEDLKKIAFEIGSDVPFFLENKASRIFGKGEKINILESILETNLILLKPNFGISTKLAYETFDELKEVKYSNLDEIEKGILTNDIYLIEKNVENCLEQAVQNNENIRILKSSLKAILPNKKFFMTGSGSVFFAFISENEKDFLETRIKTFLDNIKIFICKIKN
ncbi:4-(cytidine 5'-diphospho)-2-C-methyl-D-erythritol kinase [Fusobacterium gastrosuis]|uniref:4-(cytidine 5'-diphospho)-2-C-methyl-D-erythritol kinase n=1 Tax=Fusobacterium gastrosuis TaxID=1755100 RepID=UPI00297173C4|nr:4-(cytidine 5'-diphospho)-2-C-methyl-D-erythritol kinase [Fusobacteriaceae bacterium]MDY5712537.1 4-(cytidine 5'-diphospho)-2-C-methyl-D-erythritol kinase [Fusobacterium gastrosuis]